MLLALLALLLLAAALVAASGWHTRVSRARWRGSRDAPDTSHGLAVRDPGRELRAEQRARELLRSCVNPEEWAMYSDLGFIRVHGRRSHGRPAPYAYLIYAHKPIVAYVPRTRRVLNEYCVDFRDHGPAGSRPQLPAGDDVLAKWMALVGAERQIIASANMHLPGRQIDPGHIRRDLARLAGWERRRAASPGATAGSARAATQ